jgi:pyruvate formate lyase activating enzyme
MENVTGLIFHVIHGSFVDGYGIRTTVFLKGCPLRCVWCCNPEGQHLYAEIKLTVSECDGCGQCVEICPVNAIQTGLESEHIKVRLNRSLCTNCGKCIDVCFTGALDFFGKSITVDELFNIIKKDEQFYRASGGGVSIGGGEPTLQPDFTYALLKKCRENYIHTAVDTCGYTVNDKGFRILAEADLLLFDIKGIDPKEHMKNTGVSNEPILKNLKKLNDMGKPIIIRIPVIPGYTDSSQNLKVTAAFLSGLNSVERVDLIAYHEYGKVKYEQLGREYRLKKDSISIERMNEIKSIFEGRGLNTQLGG